MKYRLDWFAGSSAQFEVFSPGRGGGGLYQVKYTSPFRSTLRPPAASLPLGNGELDPISNALDKLIEGMGLGQARGSAAGGGVQEEDLVSIGAQLLALALPRYVQADLRVKNLYLEVGMDESLLGYPWELMHDGDDFFCLKHYLGRFINSTSARPAAQEATTWDSRQLDKIAVLVVSVPNPEPRRGQVFERLTHAEAETKAIAETLTAIDGVELHLLTDRDATFKRVFETLKGNFQIIHFNGHATFDEKVPQHSGLVLHDTTMSTGQLQSFIGQRAPMLCFVNACDTGKVMAWKDQYNVYGVAQAILQTGAYLIGSRWKLTDAPAAEFARAFYESWLGQKTPLGRAIVEARVACKAKSPKDDIAWGSYVFYGDPRVYFRATET